jgi:hypothetical protein
MTSIPSRVRYPLAMATALTAWFTAPAPIAWTSARPLSLIIPAIAPATAVDLDLAATLMMSIVAASFTDCFESQGLISCIVWQERHIIEAQSKLSYYYFTPLLERKQDPGYSAKVSVTFLIRDAADFALAWLVRDQLHLGLSWPGPQYIVADSQIIETFHWALLSGKNLPTVLRYTREGRRR